MTLIVEDGSGMVDSNSYASVATVRTYAAARGVTLSPDDSVVEPMVINAMDYIEAQRAKFQGQKSFPENPQALQWPRSDVYIDCLPFPNDAIPSYLVNALAQCVIEISKGNDLQANTTGQVVKMEKVDVIETIYMTGLEQGAGASFTPSYPKVDSLMAPLYNGCGAGAALKTVRV